MGRTFGWDYPPGCSEQDIPGNRPEDSEWERLNDDLVASGLTAQEIRALVFDGGPGDKTVVRKMRRVKDRKFKREAK